MAKRTLGIDVSNPKTYTSLIYGVVTVVVLFLILFFGIRAIQQRQAGVTPTAEETTAAREYEVKEGDTLWSIAEKEYKDGYKWTEIARANNLSDPDDIEKGMKLTLPETSAPTQTAVAVPAEPVGGKITGESYRIVEGDNLWDISVRAYGDGFKWPELVKENKIPNPDLIYPGDEIKLPR